MTDLAGWAGFSPQEMGDLIRYLQPWFDTRGSTGGIQAVRSKDRTVRVLRPRGPVVDLSVRAGTGTVIYDYTVPAATTQAAIDTSTDGPNAGLIAQTFDVLEVFFSGRTDGAVHQTFANVTFNGDTGAHYDVIGVQSSGGAVVPINQTSNNNQTFPVPGASARSLIAGAARFSLPNYAGGTLQKAGEGNGGFQDTSAANSMYWTVAFGWRPATAVGINRIHVAAGSGSWVENSRLTVVGYKH